MLFRYELIAVLRKSVYRRRLTTEEAREKLKEATLLRVVTFINDTFLQRAYQLAEQFNRPSSYDAQYLAVAEQLGCEFWTADEKLYNAVSESLSWVKWLGNFKQTQTPTATPSE
ncbi:MAG: type II toxin-antitoxin system VapC family toxin [Anaerolineae bacterium]|nr:type II toxin-antitoxin system VapC family toxin [Anaerolineae bacterium]